MPCVEFVVRPDGLGNSDILEEARWSSIDESAENTLQADKVLLF